MRRFLQDFPLARQGPIREDARFPMLKNNPVMKKLVETGEERIGKLAQQLLSNEKFVTAVQTLVSRSLAAKGTLDSALRTALSAANLPSTADLEQLRSKVDDLERLLSSVEGKVDTLLASKAPQKK
ncbi:hypothetical protein A176_001095 [Myxococcus hansupus]|uniref:Uncharacterized protein n=2 Tax=Pseudomyxococcus hansupus TaxID=1297742 RepID=A0A0H4WRH0_9BACT|nr:hypothetical protein A176_001095 [Myxococcus hansupus]